MQNALAIALPAGLQILPYGMAEDSDAFVVTRETARKYGLTSLADLKKQNGKLVIGAAPEVKKRQVGAVGLKDVYGVEFKEFKSLDSSGPLVKGALKKGDVDVANLFTTDTDIVANDWVVLSDPKNLIPGQHVVPLIADRKADSTVRKALADSATSSPPKQLTELNRQVDKDKKDPRGRGGRLREAARAGEVAGRRRRPESPLPNRGANPSATPAALSTVDRMTGMDARDTELKKELDATLQARRELGEEYESALVDSFLEKVDQRIDGAVERRLRRQLAEQQMAAARGSRSPQAHRLLGRALRLRHRLPGAGDPAVRDRRRRGPPPGTDRRLGRHRRRQRLPGRPLQPGPVPRPTPPVLPGQRLGGVSGPALTPAGSAAPSPGSG